MSNNWTIKRSLWGAACSAAQPLMLNVLSIPAMAFIIRRLGPVSYGQWTIATTIIAGLGIFTNLGMRGTFVRTVARSPESAATALSEQISLRLLLSVVVLGFAVSICVALGYSHTIIVAAAIAGVGMIVGTIASTAADLFQAFNQLPTVAYANFVAGLILTIVSVICIWLGVGPIGLSLAYLLGPVVAALLLVRAVGRQHFPVRFTWNVVRFGALVKESRFFALPLGLTAASTYAGALMLPRLVGVGSFGFFAAGMLVSSRLTIVPDSLAAAFYPAVARLYKRDREQAARFVITCLCSVAAACVAVAIMGILCSDWISRILFPSNFVTCARVMRITLWMIPLMGAENIMGYALYAAGREADQARVAILAAVCQVVLTVILTIRFGVEGAAWSVTTRYAISAAMVLPVFLRTFVVGTRALPVSPILGAKRRHSEFDMIDTSVEPSTRQALPWTRRGHIPRLDGLRAVSIALVVLSHCAPTIHSPLAARLLNYVNAGHLGVTSFFVISGFLITILLLREHASDGVMSLKSFYKRRALRLVPAYVTYLIVAGALAFFSVTGCHSEAKYWWAASTYTMCFMPKLNSAWNVGHLWSLSVEEHFYLIWPLLMTWFKPRIAFASAIAYVIATPLLRLGLWRLHSGSLDIDFCSPTQMSSIAVGCVLGYCVFYYGAQIQFRLSRVRSMALVPVAFGGLATSIGLGHVSGKFGIILQDPINASCLALIILGILFRDGDSFFGILESRPFKVVGVLSYSIYLWQQLFTGSGHFWAGRWPQNLLFILLAATLSYRLVELPFLRIKRRLAVTRTSANPETAAVDRPSMHLGGATAGRSQ